MQKRWNVSPAFEKSRRGGRTVRIENRYLHSRYDPQREAHQFVARLPEVRRQGTIIVLGDGLGVVGSALRSSPTPPRVLSLEVTDDADHRHHRDDGFLRFPAAQASVSEVRSVIRRHLFSWETPLVQVLVWPAAAAILPEWMERAQQGVVQALRDLQSELATVAVFGRRWLANAVAGTLAWEERFSPTGTTDGLILATSGPSLQVLVHAEVARSKTPIVATSSALRWLRRNNQAVSVVVHTDGGVWADRYLQDVTERQVVATPLRAGTRRIQRPWPLRTGWIGERLAIDADDWTGLPDQPTVGATLLLIGETICPGGSLSLAGLDLCTRDLEEHARPHCNDALIAGSTRRLTPEDTVRAGRVWPGATRLGAVWPDGSAAWQGPALATYRQMIQEQLVRLRGGRHVHLLAPSPALLDWASPPSNPGTPAGALTFAAQRRPPRADRRRRAMRTLSEWQDTLTTVNQPSDPRQLPDATGELMVHLAPTEFLQWITSRTEWQVVAAEAQRVLIQLLSKARHYD